MFRNGLRPNAGQCLQGSCAYVYRHRHFTSWAEAPVKIARMTLTIKLDGNWSSFQLANNTPPLSVTGSVIAPSARMSSPPRFIKRYAQCSRAVLFSTTPTTTTPTSQPHVLDPPRKGILEKEKPCYIRVSGPLSHIAPQRSFHQKQRNALAIRVVGNETTSSWSRIG